MSTASTPPQPQLLTPARGGAARATQHSGLALTRQFACFSLVVIGPITVALCLTISYYLRQDLLEGEWTLTADTILVQALDSTRPIDFVTPFSPSAQEHFEALYRRAVRIPEVVRVKIYDAAMTVVWSDKPPLFGQRFVDNSHLQGALAGRITVNLETHERKGENLYEGPEFSELVEVYVPIVFPDTSQVVGVVETYKMPARVLTKIRQGQRVVLGTALSGGVLLYLSLFGIVRRAGRRLDTQQQALVTATQEVRAVQSQLVAAERLAAVGEVVTAITHGIRNPLANIRAAAQVAALDCQDSVGCTPLVPRSLTNIMAEVDRLEDRLRELLQFVRSVERQTQPVDLHAVLQKTLQMLAGRLRREGLTVEEHWAPALPPIMGDALLLEEVFLSLIGNAIDAIPASGGLLTVRTGTVPDASGTPCVFIDISDTGVGISAAALAKVFEPFYTTKARGTGLGLTIAKKFTVAHGGTLTVQSQPGKRTVFRVTLPAHQEP